MAMRISIPFRSSEDHAIDQFRWITSHGIMNPQYRGAENERHMWEVPDDSEQLLWFILMSGAIVK